MDQGETKNVVIRLPVKVDEEIGHAAARLGMKKAQLYRNLMFTALEDYRVMDRFGLLKAVSYIAGAKGRLRDRFEEAGESLEPEQT